MAFRFESLEIWQLSIGYAKEVFGLCNKFPQEAQFNLGSQLRNSSLSVSNNIAEGSGSNSKKDFTNFLNIAIRSVYETISGLYFAKENKYLLIEKFKDLYRKSETLARKIRAFQKTLRF